MLIGDSGIPSPPEIEAQVDAALDVFFNAFGTMEDTGGASSAPTRIPRHRS